MYYLSLIHICSWTVSFVQGGPQLPASITVDSLGSWTDFVGDEYKAFSGTAVYTTTINKVPVADVIKLNLGTVAENASVYLNGEYISTVIDLSLIHISWLLYELSPES